MFVFLFVLTWDTTIKINIYSILSVLSALQVFTNLTFSTTHEMGTISIHVLRWKVTEKLCDLSKVP